jgi:DNA-directed RNA polymerase specialized sigma24 family protein
MIEVRLDELQGVTTAEIESIVRRVCRRWRCPDVDDVVQEVLLHVLTMHRKNPSYFDSSHRVLGTVCTDARRVLYRRVDVGRRLKREPVDADSLAGGGTSFEEEQWQRLKALAADCGELMRRIEPAPKSVQETFLLLCEGTQRKEVARRLGVSVATVWRRWTDAIDLLRKTLPGRLE